MTYSIALLHRLILSQFPGMDMDLQLIWSRQQVPDAITNELVRITKYVFDKITDPNRGTINVTQWCKRDVCWDSIKECSIKLSNDVERVLVSKDDKKVAERDAKKDQKLISDIEAQKKVLELGAPFWDNLNKFISAKKIKMSADQAKSMKYALRIPAQFPSAYQSLQLLSLLEEAESNGFKA